MAYFKQLVLVLLVACAFGKVHNHHHVRHDKRLNSRVLQEHLRKHSGEKVKHRAVRPFHAARNLQTVDYTLINSILSSVALDLETGDLPPIETDFLGSIITAFIGETAAISGLGLGEITLVGVLVNANTFTLTFGVSDLLFNALVGLELECSGALCAGLDLTPGGGTLTVESDTSSGSTISLTLQVVGADFSNEAVGAVSVVDAPCGDKVDLSGINFDVEGLGFLNLPFFSQDLDPLVEDIINGDPTVAIDPIQGAVCDVADPLIADAVALLNNLTATAVALFPIQSLAAAAQAEADLVAGLPAGVTLFDLKGNLVPFFPELDTPEGLTVDETNFLVQGLASFFGITFGDDGLFAGILNSLFDLDIPADATNIDVVAIVAEILDGTEADLLDLLQIDLEIPGVGSISGSADNLDVTLSSLPENFLVTAPSQNTLTASLAAGDLSFSGEFSVDLSVDVVVLDIPIQATVSETFTVDASVTGVVGTLALLLPFEDFTLPVTDLTTLFTTLAGCLVSFFFVDPTVSAALLDVSSASLSISGFNEAILFLVSELVNQLFPIYQGTLLQVGQGAAQFGLNELIKFGISQVDTTCPESRRLAAPEQITVVEHSPVSTGILAGAAVVGAVAAIAGMTVYRKVQKEEPVEV